ncbi:MAG: hypothetical protein IJX63_13305 [Lachnospiraceae bacterium]|nr:hypothetical protein [Lachnospiraceae bacterium]
MRAVYEIAGKQIEIHSLYEEVHTLCREYRSDIVEGAEHTQSIDLTITIKEEDIIYERERMPRTEQLENRAPGIYPDSYLETLAVYRKLAEELLQENTLLFHGSVIAVDGVAYLFTAKSGTGKSTHTRLWREHFGDRAVMINDDKPLLRLTDEGVWVYGTPWAGKHYLSTNTVVPLKAICILNRAATNQIQQVEAMRVYSMLLQQVYRPGTAKAMEQTMKLLDGLMQKLEFYILGCNMEPEAAVVAYEGMNGGRA